MSIQTRVLCLFLCFGVSSCKKGDSSTKAKPESITESQTSSITDKLNQKPFRKFLSTDDLPEIQKRNHLRVLVYRSGENFLPRNGMPASRDREQALDLGQHIGAEIEFIVVDDFSELIPKLLKGEGDLIAAQMTVTDAREKKVSFTRPNLVIKEMLVGRKSAPNNPKTLSDLKGASVHVRSSSSYAQTLRALNAEKNLGVKIVPAAENKDAETLAFEVTQGEMALTVVDSHILRVLQSYNPAAQGLFPIAEKREIAWAVRPNNKELLAAANAVLMESALTVHKNELFRGDLDEIRKRGVIRVLTANNPISYFLYRGQQFGFEFELATMLAKALELRLEIVVPSSYDQLIPMLLEGRGDIIAASLTETPERARRVQFSRRYLEVQELLVQPADAPPLTKIGDLNGKEIHVRRSSSYFERLQTLKKQGIKINVVEVDESLDTEALVDLVSQKKIPLTVADSHFVQLMKNFGSPIQAALSLNPKNDGGATHSNISFAVRPSSPMLLQFVNGFVKKTYRGVEFNIARKRYFGTKRKFKKAQSERSRHSKQISPYDAVIKKYAMKYGFDWRLMSAQAYAESRFNPNAQSWVGAKGLFQVMPKTGASMGFQNLEDPEQGTHAGIKYMSRLMRRFDKNIPFRQRVRFALAAYNAGLGHVIDARRLAKQKGWDPNRWFGNVEKAMLLLKERKYARAARHGYCRGTEPVKYVSKIQTYYDAYVKVVK